jgi:DNA-directed RNA polymerase subunit RPC12/RpoP
MAETIEHKCPNCGGSLIFDPNSQTVTCKYCGTEIDVTALTEQDEILDQFEGDFSHNTKELFSDDGEFSTYNIYQCGSCASQIICDENTTSTICPFCDSPVILSGRLSGVLKPNYVIPFKDDGSKIKTLLENYLKKKILLPSAFKKEKRAEDIHSVYVPYWVYDTEVYAKLRFRGVRVRTWISGDYKYTKTSHYRVVREGKIAFDRIPVDGSSRMPDDLLESLEPYNFAEAVPFQTGYLSGYLAEKYDLDQDVCNKRAQERIKQGTIDAFKSTIYDVTNVFLTNSSFQTLDHKVDYCLYPVWLFNVHWNNKIFPYGVNGQTSKIIGNLPVSEIKLFLFCLIVWAGLFTGLSLLFVYIVLGVLNAIGIATSALIGFIALIVSMVICVKRYKPVKKQSGAKHYYRKDSLNMDVARTIYLYSTTTRIRINYPKK